MLLYMLVMMSNQFIVSNPTHAGKELPAYEGMVYYTVLLQLVQVRELMLTDIECAYIQL